MVKTPFGHFVGRPDYLSNTSKIIINYAFKLIYRPAFEPKRKFIKKNEFLSRNNILEQMIVKSAYRFNKSMQWDIKPNFKEKMKENKLKNKKIRKKTCFRVPTKEWLSPLIPLLKLPLGLRKKYGWTYLIPLCEEDEMVIKLFFNCEYAYDE